MSNWTDINIRTTKHTDEYTFHTIREALIENKFPISRITLHPEIGGPEILVNIDNYSENKELEEIFKEQAQLIKQFYFTFPPNLAINLTRAPDQTSDALHISLTNLTNQPQHINRIQFIKLTKTLKEKLKALNLKTNIRETLGSELQRHYEIREAELSKLETITTKAARAVTDEALQVRERLEEEYRNRNEALRREHELLQESLRNEYVNKEADLTRRESDLQTKLKDIDDRESRHARRTLRQDLKVELAKRSDKFELTQGTRKLRLPVLVFTILLLALFGTGLVIYSYISIRDLLTNQPTSTATLVSTAIKQFAFAIGFASTSIFFIRWNNTWFQAHADEEFRQKRFHLDLDRASWVVEMAMEWKEDKGTEIPRELLDRLTNSLFVEKGNQTEHLHLHPADQLASALLGASAEASLEMPGGTKLKLDRKSIKELSKPKD